MFLIYKQINDNNIVKQMENSYSLGGLVVAKGYSSPTISTHLRWVG